MAPPFTSPLILSILSDYRYEAIVPEDQYERKDRPDRRDRRDRGDRGDRGYRGDRRGDRDGHRRRKYSDDD